MKLNTLRFGEIEIDTEQTIVFAHGIPGFDELSKFILLQPDPEVPFTFLQSLENTDLSFILTNPFAFYPEYEFILPEAAKEELEIEKEQDFSIWSIVSIKESIQEATLNLLAPVIIQEKAKLGKQIILQGTPYRTKHALIQGALKEKEETSDVSSITQEG